MPHTDLPVAGAGLDVELVVLLDELGRPTGTAPKATVHTTDTPLHLAFSCWLLDEDGRVLLTRRAAVKRTWPGIWTNAFCGHPGPGEAIPEALHRRARQELGAAVAPPAPALPDFRYRAVMADGIVENEVCPVFTSRLLGPLRPDPAEVDDHRWTSVPALLDAVAREPEAYSPWLREQLPGLVPLLAA